MIQTILTTAGTGVTLEVPAATLTDLEITNDSWQGKSVHDATQSIISLIGGWLGYEYNETTEDEEYTLRMIDYNDTTTDFHIDYEEDMIFQQPTTTGIGIYNVITLYYTDSTTGERKSVKVSDTTSINAYGKRVGIITESDTAGIDDETKATLMANAILASTKDKVIDFTMKIPFAFKINGKRLKFGQKFSLDYPFASSSTTFNTLESYRHVLDFENGDYYTEIQGNQNNVRTGITKWQKMIRRPGLKDQKTGRDLSSLTQIPAPTSLTVVETGLEAIALTPRAYAVLSCVRPQGQYPREFVFEVKRSIDTDYSKAQKVTVRADEIAGNEVISTRVSLDVKTEYDCRVYAINTDGIKGLISSEVTINEIGDSVAPAKPTGVIIFGGNEGVNVTFNSNSENDLLGYNIYYKSAGNPTKEDFDKIKKTNSNDTILPNLEPKDYYIRVSAYDSSGNESDLSDTQSPVRPSPILEIRTQQEFENWSETVLSSSYITPNYNILRINDKGSNYTLGTSLEKISELIKIEKDKFKIETVGDVTIDVYTTQNQLFDFKCDNLYINDIATSVKECQGDIFTHFEFNEKTTGIGNINFNNVKALGLLKNNDLISPSATLNNKNINIIDCYSEKTRFLADFNTLNNCNLLISNCETKQDVGYLTPITFVANSTSKININKNKIVDGGIRFVTSADNTTITENEFRYTYDVTLATLDNPVPLQFIVNITGTNTTDNLAMNNNQIYYEPATIDTIMKFTNANANKSTSVIGNIVSSPTLLSEEIIKSWGIKLIGSSQTNATVSGRTVTIDSGTFGADYEPNRDLYMVGGGYEIKRKIVEKSTTTLTLDIAINSTIESSISSVIVISEDFIVSNNSKSFDTKY